MPVIKETLKFGAILGGLALVALAITPAKADIDCSRQDVRLDGDLGGGEFSVPARLGTAGVAPNIGLSEQDCVRGNEAAQKARRDGRRAASIAASMDHVSIGDGLNLRFNGANTGLGNDDTYAVGTTVGYQHTFTQPLGGVIHGIAGDAGFSADTTGSDYGAKVGITLNFGTF